jgi:hypothetical protein
MIVVGDLDRCYHYSILVDYCLIAVLSGLPDNRMPGEGNTFPLPEPSLYRGYA